MPKLLLKKPLSLHWTLHSRRKMRQYGFSEARVRRVLHAPLRVEEGIAPKTFAFMQPIGNGNHEMWVMVEDKRTVRWVISAWRYPGRTKPRSLAALDLMRAELQSYVRSVVPVRAEKKEVLKKKIGRTKWFRPDKKRTGPRIIDISQ